MNATTAHRRGGQRGFSLLEVMVGVAIGLIGIVVIFQVLEVWESRKRTTSSGSDAQIAGTIAMFNLERDVKQGGFGFGSSTYMGCTVNAVLPGGAAYQFGLYPVQIVDGAAGAPDTINTLYGSSPFFTSSQTFTLSTPTSKKTTGNGSFQPGEMMLVAGNSPANCDLVEVTDNATAAGHPTPYYIQHTTNAYTNYLGTAGVAPTRNGATTVGTYSSGVLYNLGPAPRRITWQIQANNSLAWSDGLQTPATWSNVAEGIVNLQAQYGVDLDNNNMIECPNAGGACEWTIATPANWTKVRAIRVALLSRSQQFEKTAVTTAAPSWSGGAFVMNDLDGGADSNPGNANDWRHYRYRVFEQVIPLRNMIWGTAP